MQLCIFIYPTVYLDLISSLSLTLWDNSGIRGLKMLASNVWLPLSRSVINPGVGGGGRNLSRSKELSVKDDAFAGFLHGHVTSKVLSNTKIQQFYEV